MKLLPWPRTAKEPSAVPASSIEVAARHLRLDGGYCASFAVTGYPREVTSGWLEPLLTYPGRLDVTLHVEPIPPMIAADRLRRQLARLESSQRADEERGRLQDFEAEVAAEDAHELATRLARGEGRLFRVGLYLTVHAADEHALETETTRVRALAASLLLDAKPATFRSLQGWITTLPLGTDLLGMRRSFDTDALAAAFPFTSPDLAAQQGRHPVLYGINADSSSLVIWDRFACENHNATVLGSSGFGKSYLIKTEVLRAMYTGVQIFVIDPEDEYNRLATAVGGTRIALGAPGVHLNPFDLPAGEQDAFTRQALFIHTLVSVMLGESPSPQARAALDRAVLAAYNQAGITSDPRTWSRPAPLLADLSAALNADPGDQAHDLAARLAPYVTGSHRELFNEATTTRPYGHLIVFSLREVADELKPICTLLTLDAIWRQVSDPTGRRPRLVVVDEAWLLMRQAEGAKFLFRLAKSARKHWTGLTVITQDVADVLGSDLGRAVVSNAATQILLRQAPQAIDHVADAFHLTFGERQMLLAAPRGRGLLACGPARVAFENVSSPAEHRLCTTDPAELLEMDSPA